MDHSTDCASTRPTRRPQFGIAAMLWSTLVVALALGYLRQIGSPAVIGSAAGVLALAVIVGAMMGWVTDRLADATYWSVIVSTAAFISVAGDLAAQPSFRYAWAAVGIFAGASCGAIAPQRLRRRMLVGAIASGVAMAVCSLVMTDHDLEWIFDLLCAPIIGALVAVLIELILWLERKSYSPRYITASWLLGAVIVGNMLVPMVLM